MFSPKNRFYLKYKDADGNQVGDTKLFEVYVIDNNDEIPIITPDSRLHMNQEDTNVGGDFPDVNWDKGGAGKLHILTIIANVFQIFSTFFKKPLLAKSVHFLKKMCDLTATP